MTTQIHKPTNRIMVSGIQIISDGKTTTQCVYIVDGAFFSDTFLKCLSATKRVLLIGKYPSLATLLKNL